MRLANLRCRSPAGSPRRGSVLIRHARRADGARRAITSLGLGRLKAASDLGGSLPAQVIATRLFDALDDIRRQRRPLIAERLELASELLSSLLPSWSWDRPQGGLCLWVRLPHGSATEFSQLALRHGVLTVPGPLPSRTAASTTICGYPSVTPQRCSKRGFAERVFEPERAARREAARMP